MTSQQSMKTFFEKLLKNIRIVVILVLAVFLIAGSVFTIDPEEVGVIVRFGQYIKTVDPGLNFKIPFAETVYKVPVEKQQKLEFGFRTTDRNNFV